MIEGIKTKLLVTHLDERGRLFEILRSDEGLFVGFGQAYVTTVYPGVVKAWHMHKEQTDSICLLQGRLKLVAYDSREDSPSRGEVQEFFLADDQRMLVQIPPLVYHGFKNIGSEEALVLNLPDKCYDIERPDEYRIDPHHNDIPYDWARRDG
jgi:dTDP-4-dehydrorhamnose 3,5-epimerase